MIVIIARRMAGDERHDHIQSAKWHDVGSTETKVTAVADIVRWLDESSQNRAVVGSYPEDFVEVGTVHPDYERPHIRTYANGAWTDNLLSLPTF